MAKILHGSINIENNQETEKLKSQQNCLKWMLDDSKHNYYSRLVNKLLNAQKNSKPQNRNGPY